MQDTQSGIKIILQVCSADGFDMFPSSLVTDSIEVTQGGYQQLKQLTSARQHAQKTSGGTIHNSTEEDNKCRQFGS